MPEIERRRNIEVCPLHGVLSGTVDRIESKFDILYERQTSLMEDMTHVKHQVDNGLKAELKAAVKESLDAFDKKYQGVLEFKWFREFATSFRDKLFINTIKAFGLIVLLLFMMNMSTELFATFLKGIR